MVDYSGVKVTMYRWAGSWGPFRIKVPCGECSLTQDVIRDTLANELKGIPVQLEIFEWLSAWWQPLRRGGWHAPIVMVEDKVISQGSALNRGVLTQAVIEHHSRRSPVKGNHLFGKEGCPHCERGKKYFEEAGIGYTCHNVVRDPRALYEMLARVKPLVGAKIPITVPQIWINGEYVGGADQLGKIIQHMVQPNTDRGQGSLPSETPLK
jgi:glutaredoxin